MNFRREQAILILSIFDMTDLSKSARVQIIEEYSLSNYEMPVYASSELDNALRNSEHNPYDPVFSAVLMDSVSYAYYGVQNQFLIVEMESRGVFNAKITGEKEALVSCPCCGYETLPNWGQYDICKICGWEDDGNRDELRYSSVNRGTLADYQSKLREQFEENTKFKEQCELKFGNSKIL